MSIPFTQYLMPDGRRREVTIDLDEATEKKAQEILAAGYVFECEMLSDYRTISLTIGDPDRELDLACKLVQNGPLVPEKVKEMIMEFQLD